MGIRPRLVQEMGMRIDEYPLSILPTGMEMGSFLPTPP